MENCLDEAAERNVLYICYTGNHACGVKKKAYEKCNDGMIHTYVFKKSLLTA